MMSFSLLGVELIICLWIGVMLIADLLLPPAKKSSLWLLALAGVAIAGGALWTQSQHALWRGLPAALGAAQAGEIFQDMFIVDPFSSYFKALFLITAAIVILMTREFQAHVPAHLGAFFMLLFTALLGTLVLASINDLLILFLGLELLTFSLYIMAAYLKTDSRSVEAGMKYLILGSVSSGFLIYGIALLYGFAGGTSFTALRAALANTAGPVPLTAQAGLVLLLAGLGFKIAAVPFHLWVPDVYEGAPTPVVAFLSVGSKMAGVIAMLRVLYGVWLPLHSLWGPMVALVSAATMLYGNLCAIPQTNIKRLLGYSSIGHAGYLLMGLSTGSVFGVSAVAYYLLAFLVSNLTVFFVVIIVSEAVGGDLIEHYQGLSTRSPGLAAAMFIGLLSLAGVPPLAGFVGKLFVLLGTMETGRLWLVALGAVNVAISLYYYLMIVKRMYLDAPRSTAPIRVHPLAMATIGVLVVGIAAIGIVQEPFLTRITHIPFAVLR
ncbi:MAG: NADH-quinone oxidoreductase subunit N [Candidatus Omnitrophica bacterium]|nr:NADH-quinone oxidoreductase subunit N [Candidatus Omnitrophota bacterium]